MSQGQEYLSKKEALAYKLELLHSILPLLSPILAKPSPVTVLSENESARATKRKHDGDRAAGDKKLAPDLAASDADASKKARVSIKPEFSVTVKEVGAPPPPPSSTDPLPAHSTKSEALVPTAAPRQEGFTRDRLRKLGVAYRDKGREVKHEGDRTRRDGGSMDPSANRLATLQQCDAVMIYVFSYWCDDQAAKQTNVGNWKAIFGLLSFVKSSAEKAGMSIVVGLCLRIEAYILHRIFLHDQKNAIYRASQLVLPPSPALPTSSLPLSANPSAQSPPSPLPSHSPPHSSSTSHLPSPTNTLLSSFSKSGQELFRFSRLWEEAAPLLSPAVLVRECPRTWRLCVETNVGVDASDWGEPKRPWRFAWPVDLSRIQGIVQEVGFARAVLEEMGEREGLQFVPAVVVVVEGHEFIHLSLQTTHLTRLVDLLASHSAASHLQSSHLLIAQKQSSSCSSLHQHLKSLDHKMQSRFATLGSDMNRRVVLGQTLLHLQPNGPALRRLLASYHFKVLEISMDFKTKKLLRFFEERRKTSVALGVALEACRATLAEGMRAGIECEELDERIRDEVLQLVILWKRLAGRFALYS